MVTRYILLMIVLASAAFAQCNALWQCDEWSECSIMEFNTRTCEDINECNDSRGKPIEIKRCDDENMYEINNTPVEIETISEPEPDVINEPGPSIFVGLGIVLIFVILGAIIGRIIKN